MKKAVAAWRREQRIRRNCEGGSAEIRRNPKAAEESENIGVKECLVMKADCRRL